MKYIFLIDKYIEKIVSILLIIVVFSMLFFSVFSIVMRYWSISLIWIEPFIRHLVFLSAFLGGVMATGKKCHLVIDVFGTILKKKSNIKFSLIIDRTTYLISIFTLLWISWASYRFMIVEFEYGREIFWGIHSGFLVGIIPCGFLLITYRFFTLLCLSFHDAEVAKS